MTSRARPGGAAALAIAHRRHGLTAGVLLAMTLAGCAAPTTFARTWEDPAYRGGPLRKVAIFVVHRDAAVRQLAEEEAVRRLPPGTLGAPGHALESAADADDPEGMAARLRARGFDGTIAFYFVGTGTARTWVPAQAFPVAVGPPSFGSFYGMSRREVHVPGHYEQTRVVLVQTRVYTLAPERLVWAGDSETPDPRSPRQTIDSVIGATMKALEETGLLPAR